MAEGAFPTIVCTATRLKQGALGALKILSKNINANELLTEVGKLGAASVAA